MIAGNDDNEEEAAQYSAEEEEGTALIPFSEDSVYGKVPKLKDPIADKSILERRSIALKKGLKLLEEEQRNAAKNQGQGMNSWNKRGRSDHILMNSVGSQSDYKKRVHYIQTRLGFGKKHVVSPLFLPQGLNCVYLCQF